MELYDALQLTQVAHGGEAIGRAGNRLVFVPYALPGEVVRAKEVDGGAKWARAQLLEVMSPSPDRVAPRCPYFGPDGCAGCQWQHIHDRRQPVLKREIVSDQLRRFGGEVNPPVQPTLRAEKVWGYRNQVFLAIGENGIIGLPQGKGKMPLPVETCPLWSPPLADLAAALDIDFPGLQGVTLRVGMVTGDAMAILHGRGDVPELSLDLPLSVTWQPPRGTALPLVGNPFVEDEIAGRHFRFSTGSPFPDNSEGISRLITVMRDLLQPEGHERLLNLYGGAGLFGLSLSDDVSEVMIVDPSSTAMDDAEANSSNVENVTLYEGQVLDVLQALPGPVEVVLLTPPRQGAGRQVLAPIGRLRPRKLLYVAEDVATLARDAVFCREIGYRLKVVQPLDLAPQTAQVTAVALWER